MHLTRCLVERGIVGVVDHGRHDAHEGERQPSRERTRRPRQVNRFTARECLHGAIKRCACAVEPEVGLLGTRQRSETLPQFPVQNAVHIRQRARSERLRHHIGDGATTLLEKHTILSQDVVRNQCVAHDNAHARHANDRSNTSNRACGRPRERMRHKIHPYVLPTAISQWEVHHRTSTTAGRYP